MKKRTDDLSSFRPSRRHVMAGGLATITAPLLYSASNKNAAHAAAQTKRNSTMSPKAFVYTEVQISVPFDQAPWREINAKIKQQPGFLNKTWLSGQMTNSLGGIYAFDSIENAQKFVTGYFPTEAGGFGAAHNTRIFDADIVREASLDLNSPHFGSTVTKQPKAFVYTEVQINKPFEEMPWTDRNHSLRQEPGLMAKTWLSGLHTHTVGGFDVFDSLENAQDFALNSFPKTAQAMNAAFYTRIFNAEITETASRDMNSPYYPA